MTPESEYSPPPASPGYGMVIDLNRCVGCQTCTAACKHANDTTPGVQWRQVLDLEYGTFPDVQRQFLVTGCQHCADPPCVPVCPTGATFAREDGLVVMEYADCIGCGYCAVACPYQARTIAHEHKQYFGSETAQETAVAHPERTGVAQKCTFCIDRIDDSEQNGLVPGVDAEVTPACSSSCIAQAIHFGDFTDSTSKVAGLLAENQTVDMHAGLGTNPRIHYMLETPAVAARENSAADVVAGPLQQFWDFRAATNFICGAAGAGAIFMATLAWAFAGMSADTLTKIFVVGAAVMLCGLGAVFLEIGRKSRALYVFHRPGSSWMSREALAAVVLLVLIGWDWLGPAPWLHILVALAAASFLFCQARIIHAARGIPAWRVPEIPTLFLAGGAVEGAGAVAIFTGLFAFESTNFAALSVFSLVGLCIGAAVWLGYCQRAHDDFSLPDSEPAENLFSAPTRDALGEIRWPVLVIGFLLPALGILLGYGSHSLTPWIPVATGVLAICGGIMWKVTLVTRAAHHQGITLPKLPGRGSGTRAAKRRDGFSRSTS